MPVEVVTQLADLNDYSKKHHHGNADANESPLEP